MATPALSIPQLFEIIKHSFLSREFDEVQEILMGREKKMTIEIQDLRRDARLLEDSQSLAELEILRMEEKLRKSQRTCEEFKEEIARLSEENRVFCDRAKRAVDRHAKLSKEVYDIICEKNKLMLDLEGKMNELIDKEDLVVELRRKQYEAEKEMAELKLQNLEATRKMRQSKPENRMGKTLNVKVEDGKKLDFSDMIKGWKQGTNADIENVATMSGSDDTPLAMEGCRNDVHPTGAAGGTSGSQFKHNSSSAEINETAPDSEEKKPVFSGSHRVYIRTPDGSRHSSKTAVLHSATNGAIEMNDSDDEAKPGGTTYISNTSYLKNMRKRKLV